MPGALVVGCHPEPASFTLEWARVSAAALRAQGWQVVLSDLYATGFDPAERGALYAKPQGDRFDPLRWQDKAGATGGLDPKVATELARLEAADLLVLHFPLWWFGPPAMLKGWLDRVLVHGRMHSSARRFDRGPAQGKRVLLCVSTGSSEAESGPNGKEGDVRLLLWPLAYALRYCGFDIHEPALVHGVHDFHAGAARQALAERVQAVLAGQAALLAELPARPLWRFNVDAEFDAEGRLGPGAEAIWPFITPQSRD